MEPQTGSRGHLEERAHEKAEEAQDKRRKEAKKKGKEYRPRKDISGVRPDAKDQYNFTDHESRIMLSSDKAFIQGYNAQATVDAGNSYYRCC